MKKTLVALAVLAASGASFAQATISGTYAFGYQSTSGGGAATSAGLGTDTSDINFAASEDLGGGMKASAKMGISGAHRGNAVVGNTATVGISSSSFGLTLGTIESTNGLLAIGSSGAAGFGMDGRAISGSSNIDVLALSIPVTSAFTLGFSYVDRGAQGIALDAAKAIPKTASSGTGLGLGTSGTAGAQPSFTIGGTYAAGALTAKLDATTWSRNGDNDVTQPATGYNKNRFRATAAYDLGVARVSAGYSSLNADVIPAVGASTGLTANETLLGVKVPFGAVTVGLDYAISTTTGMQDTSGYSLGVGYDLSKRTNIGFSMANWKAQNVAATAAAVENSNAFRVLVAHSF